MYRKVMFSLMLLSLILLSLIAWKVGVFTAIVGLPFFPLVEKIVTNTYFSGVACSIIAVIIIIKYKQCFKLIIIHILPTHSRFQFF